MGTSLHLRLWSPPRRVKNFFALVKGSVVAWVDHRASSLGAALAYYTAFSIAPTLLMVIGIAGLVFGGQAAERALFEQLEIMVGPNGAQAIQAMLTSARDTDAGIVATLVGAVTLFIGATTVFAELQAALNLIWDVPVSRDSGVIQFLRARVKAFGVVAGIGFLLAVSLVLSAGIAALGTLWGQWFEDASQLLQVLDFAVFFFVITALFAIIYKLLPEVKIAWSDVWIGAAVTALLFSVGKLLISLYLGRSAISSSFGAAGAFVVLLVWIYYSSQIFLLGAEFTRLYALRHGSHARGKPGDPSAGAGLGEPPAPTAEQLKQVRR